MARMKTRFIYEYNGSSYELFSIQEDKEGGLSLYKKTDQRNLNRENLSEYPIKEDRYSIHATSKSSGTLIKKSLVLSSGQVTTAAKFVVDSKKHLLTHIYTKCHAAPTTHQTCKPKSKDEVLLIGSFEPHHRTTLVTTTLVTNAAQQLPSIKGYTLTSKTFSLYRIWVYSSYLNIQASNDSLAISWATSPIQVNGEILKDSPQIPRNSLDISELESTLLATKEWCAAEYVKNIIERGKGPESLMHQPLFFHPSPEDLELGRLERDQYGLLSAFPEKRF